MSALVHAGQTVRYGYPGSPGYPEGYRYYTPKVDTVVYATNALPA